MTIRRANKDDVKSIQAVITESVLATHMELYPEEDIQETLNNYTIEKINKYIKNNDYFVAEDNNIIVGCVLVEKNEMRCLYVLPPYMNKGLGRKLVEVAEESIKQKGHDRVWLWSSLLAQNFYRHLGYKDVKEIPNRNGLILHIEMEKSL